MLKISLFICLHFLLFKMKMGHLLKKTSSKTNSKIWLDEPPDSDGIDMPYGDPPRILRSGFMRIASPFFQVLFY